MRKCGHFAFKPRQQPTPVIVSLTRSRINAFVLVVRNELEHACDASNLIYLTYYFGVFFITVT